MGTCNVICRGANFFDLMGGVGQISSGGGGQKFFGDLDSGGGSLNLPYRSVCIGVICNNYFISPSLTGPAITGTRHYRSGITPFNFLFGTLLVKL